MYSIDIYIYIYIYREREIHTYNLDHSPRTTDPPVWKAEPVEHVYIIY